MSATIDLLLHTPQFIGKIRTIFEETPLIGSAKKLKETFSALLNGTKISPDFFKQYLSEKDILQYSRSAPRGYSIDLNALNKVQKESMKNKQYDLFQYPEFIEHLKTKIPDNKIISSMKKLNEIFESMDRPPQWRPSDIKKELSDKNILEYQRSAPRGYLLNHSLLDERTEKVKKIYLLHLNNEPFGIKDQKEPVDIENQDSIKESDILVNNRVDPPETIKDAKIIKSKKEPDIDKEKDIVEKKEENDISKTSATTDNYSNRDIEDILHTIPRFPPYLLDRMPKMAQKGMAMGLLEFNRMDIDDLKKYSDALASGRMFYDGKYDNEREIIDHLDQKMRYLTTRLEKLHNKEANELINKYVIQKIKKGKFDKYITTLKEGRSYDDVAWDICEKLGRKKRKIPLNDFALRRRVVEILEDLFPSN